MKNVVKPGKSRSPIAIEEIDGMIRTIRDVRVLLDRDLARIYGVPTFRFNEAIKRNRHRFPPDFMFQLTREEFDSLRSQSAMSKSENSSQFAMSSGKHRGAAYLPYAFTEHGALQAANILRSSRAVQMSVFVIRAFVKMREALRGTPELARKLAALEQKLTARLDVHEAAIVQVLREVMQILNPPPEPEPPRKRIGFHTNEQPPRYRTRAHLRAHRQARHFPYRMDRIGSEACRKTDRTKAPAPHHAGE